MKIRYALGAVFIVAVKLLPYYHLAILVQKFFTHH